MSEEQLSIQVLISSRCHELGLRPVEVVRRCGYRNVSKGLRRLEDISRGCFAGTDTLIRGLPVALEVPADVVQQAVEDTKRQIFEAREATWRAAFSPHAIIMTERERPSQIFIAAILGVSNLRRVDFDLSQGPLSFVQQALEGLREKLAKSNGVITTFGRATGFIINFDPDYAVRFDLEGKPVEALDRAYRLGEATFHLKGMGRPLSRGELDTIFGGKQIKRGSQP
jgi:hypothetical protein